MCRVLTSHLCADRVLQVVATPHCSSAGLAGSRGSHLCFDALRECAAIFCPLRLRHCEMDEPLAAHNLLCFVCRRRERRVWALPLNLVAAAEFGRCVLLACALKNGTVGNACIAFAVATRLAIFALWYVSVELALQAPVRVISPC